MPFADDATASAYRAAWDAWTKQLEHLHRVFLDGDSIRPDQIKGLLNREARAKQHYDELRLRLLGIESGDSSGGPADDGNPFR